MEKIFVILTALQMTLLGCTVVTEGKKLDKVPIVWPVGSGTNRISCHQFQKIMSDLPNKFQYLVWHKCVENCQSEDNHVWQPIARMNHEGSIRYENGTNAFYTLYTDGILEIQNVNVADNNTEYRCDARMWDLMSDHIMLRYYKEQQENTCTCTCPTTCQAMYNTTNGSGKPSESDESSTVWSWVLTGKILVVPLIVSIAINLILARPYLKKCFLRLFENISGLFRSQNEITGISSDAVNHQNPTFEVPNCDGGEKSDTEEIVPGTDAGGEIPLGIQENNTDNDVLSYNTLGL